MNRAIGTSMLTIATVDRATAGSTWDDTTLPMQDDDELLLPEQKHHNLRPPALCHLYAYVPHHLLSQPLCRCAM